MSLSPPPLPPDLVTLATLGLVAFLGAAGAQAVAPYLVVLFVALVSSAVAAGSQNTEGEKKGAARIIFTHTATALLLSLPLAVFLGRVDGSLLDWRWLVSPVTATLAYLGPAIFPWIIETGKNLFRARLPQKPQDAQETKQ